MKIIQNIMVCVVVAAFPLFAHAGKSNLDAQAYAVQHAYREAGDIKADFVQHTHVKMLDRDITKKGRMYFKEGGKFRIEYRGRGGKHYISDGATLWVHVPGDASTLAAYRVDEETVPKEALTFLSGFDNLTKDFRIKPSKSFTDLESGETAFYLEPKSKNAHFTALDAKFNERHLLVDLKVHNKSGNVSTYTFTRIQTSSDLPDALFVYGSGGTASTATPH